MSGTEADLRTAKEKADRARADLVAVLGELQQRVMPAALVKDGIEAMHDKAAALGAKAEGFARRKPVVTAGAAAAVTAAILWKPMRRMFSRRSRNQDGAPQV